MEYATYNGAETIDIANRQKGVGTVKRWVYVAIGGLLGAAASVVYNYLFGPAPETTFDKSYQSRLDWALAEGEKAAASREAELRAQFEAAKQPRPPAPPVGESPEVSRKDAKAQRKEKDKEG